MRKCVVVVVTSVSLIGLIIGFFVVSHKSPINVSLDPENLTDVDAFETICRTPACIIATSRLYVSIYENISRHLD